MESNRIFPFLSDKVLNESGANPGVDGFEKVRNLGPREFNILGLEDLEGGGGLGVISRTGQRAERTHLKSDVLVLLENPSGVFEDLIHILLSQLLEIRHSRLEFFAHVVLVLAETEKRPKEHTEIENPQRVAGVRKRTVVANPTLGHASSSRYTGISAPRISIRRATSELRSLSSR